MIYLSFIAGLISIVLTATGFWAVSYWVGAVLLAIPVLWIAYVVVLIALAAGEVWRYK